MNRFKLLKVGDELHLVRQQRPGVNDILIPDTLNRTNIRLEDDLKDLLGVDDAQIEGVSKDIQLVSVVSELEKLVIERQTFNYANTLLTDFSLDLQATNFVTIEGIYSFNENGTAGVENLDYSIIGSVASAVPSTPDRIQLFQNLTDSLPAQAVTITRDQGRNDGLVDRVIITSNSASNPFRAVPEGWFDNIDLDIFTGLTLRVEPSAANAAIDGTFHVDLKFHNERIQKI